MRQDVTACILCSRNCGLHVELEEGRMVKIKGDDRHPFTQGYICQKAARLDHYQNHSGRLTQPLKRMPDGQFQPLSWEQALTEIAQKLLKIRNTHGGDAFAFLGGGGQGNHLGGAYNRQLMAAMRSKFSYNALAQEKTGDFWLNGRLFGKQTCHTTEDIEHADYALFIGTNPFQAHGIPNARDTLKHFQKDPNRTMVVVDPRATETAKMADVHVQLKPGSDAFFMAALLGVIVQEGLIDRDFIAQHCVDAPEVLDVFNNVDVVAYARHSDVPLETVQRVARGFAKADKAVLRIDLGIQHTLNSTLNGYLEKLLFLLTGHFGRTGCNNLHTMFLPILGNTDERKNIAGKPLKRTAYHGMMPISGMYPPNILPDEILKAGDKRVRAVWVDSANPLNTFADTAAYEAAFKALDLCVVVDVALTETARFADYVLPAASQFEKWEATGFTLEFPTNGFHLRHPLFEPKGQCLPEPEIYTRLLEKMGLIPQRFPLLERIARTEPGLSQHLGYMAALAATLARNPRWVPFAASIMYRTLGPHLKDGQGRTAAAAAPLLPLSLQYAQQYPEEVKRAGHAGNRITRGVHLFKAILNQRSGTKISTHLQQDMWRLMGYKDRKVRLAVPEMLTALKDLQPAAHTSEAYPFVLMAGERRAYNANQIYRDPAWRKSDKEGHLRIHPQDAHALQVNSGDAVRVRSSKGAVVVTAEVDDTVRVGMVTLPHGYGMQTPDGQVHGPQLNRLTDASHCDPIAKTPYHKHVPVALEKAA